MTLRTRIFVIFLFIAWFAGILYYSLKEAGQQGRIIRAMGLILIQGECYEMGNPFRNGMEDAHPVHMVCVDPFYLGKQMVTVSEFKKFVTETGYQTDGEKSRGCEVRDGRETGENRNHNWQRPGYLQKDSDPVVCVSWNDASQFIHWARQKSPGKGMDFRLPTEGEWEFAARNRGKQVPKDFAPDELKTLHRIAKREWLLDWYGENFYKEGDKTNPKGPSTGKYRVLRGGASEMNDSGREGVFVRFWKEPGYSSNEVGFRLALPMTDR